MNPYIIEIIIRERQQELCREAERQRMVAEWEAANPQEKGRLAIALGNLLIRLGNNLKARYESEQQCRQGAI